MQTLDKGSNIYFTYETYNMCFIYVTLGHLLEIMIYNNGKSTKKDYSKTLKLTFCIYDNLGIEMTMNF